MLLWTLKIGLLVYIGFGALLYFAQRSMLYLPVAENPAEDVKIERLPIEEGSLKLWVLEPEQDHAVIYFGGNAEDVYWNAADFRASLPAHAAYLVNYRGYGGSTGSPSEEALFADALRIFDELRERHTKISVIGRSLGSGIAVYLASQRPVDRLVLVTAHDSALAIAKRLYPVYPVGLMLKDRYESVRYAADVSAPTLVVIAENDTMIPREHADNLAQAFADGQVEQLVIDNAGHNDISGHARYWKEIARFLTP